MRSILVCLVLGTLSGLAADSSEAQNFLRPTKSNPAADLPADRFFPRGRKMIYGGYSGQPARDLTQGFTIAGPAYHTSNETQSAECDRLNLPHFVQIGAFDDNSTGKWETIASLSADEVKRRVAANVKRHLNSPWVVSWAVQPEELRPWRKDEMAYLKIVCDTIRATDPQQRPIFLYNPNNRDRETLAPIAANVDIIAKGCYANAHGHKDDRAWIRWSIEQEIEAATKAGPNKQTLVMPLLAADPDPAERSLIPVWVRHDVYLGLMSGANGMLLWSLHPRAEVKATWQEWYDAYALCGRELNGERALSQVFLFGERRTDLKVTTVEARPDYPLGAGLANAPEAKTTKAKEGKTGTLHPWTTFESMYGNAHYFFLANSFPAATTFRISGIPAQGLRLQSAFTDQDVKGPEANQPLEITLKPWEVVAYKFTASSGK